MADTKVIESLLRETISALKNGGAGGSVKEVDTLPEITEENKTKIFKLKDEANLYAPALIKSTTTYTNRLPDDQQIDKAYLYEGPDDIHYYKGAFKLICTDGDLNGYGWCINGSENSVVLFTLDNAVNVTLESHLYGADVHEGWVINGNTATTTDYSVSDIESEIEDSDTLSEYGIGSVIPATYNAPESAQIGSATLVAKINQEERTFKYTGNKTIIYPGTDGIEVYTWADTNTKTGYQVYSTNKASEIYGFVKDTGFYYGDTVFWVMLDFDDYSIIGNRNISSLSILPLNAPDEEQVGKARAEFLWDYGSDWSIFNYVGKTTIHCTNGDAEAFLWGDPNSFTHSIFTLNPATFYYNPQQFWVLQWYAIKDMLVQSAPMEFTFSGTLEMWEQAYENNKERFEETAVEWRIVTLPCQRTETTEQWDYISAFPVIEKRVLMKYGDGKYMNLPTEGLVNINGETMEYNGKTYYKWVEYQENGGTKEGEQRPVLANIGGEFVVVDSARYIYLTTTLEVKLPFTADSPELAYRIISEDIEDAYWHDEVWAQEALIDKFGNMTVRT